MNSANGFSWKASLTSMRNFSLSDSACWSWKVPRAAYYQALYGSIVWTPFIPVGLPAPTRQRRFAACRVPCLSPSTFTGATPCSTRANCPSTRQNHHHSSHRSGRWSSWRRSPNPRPHLLACRHLRHRSNSGTCRSASTGRTPRPTFAAATPLASNACGAGW